MRRTSKRMIAMAGLCGLVAIGFGATNRHAERNPAATEPAALNVEHKSCVTTINGVRTRMAVGDQFYVDGLWRSCTEYDGHAVVIFARQSHLAASPDY